MLTGASFSLRWLNSRAFVRMTEQGLGYSDPGPTPRTARRIARELAQLLERSGIGGQVVLVGASIGGFAVRVFASEHGKRVVGLVLLDATHEDQEHQIPQMARFVPFLSSVGALRALGMSFGQTPDSLAPSVREFARATAFRAAGQQAAADEIVHIRESVAEVKATRRKLTVPLVVVTAGRGADAVWRDLQRDQANLSPRGCQIIAEQSGHAIAVAQPQVAVDAIRAAVDAARVGRTFRFADRRLEERMRHGLAARGLTNGAPGT